MAYWLQNAPNIRRSNGAHVIVSDGFGKAVARFGGVGPALLAPPAPVTIEESASHESMGITPTPILTVAP